MLVFVSNINLFLFVLDSNCVNSTDVFMRDCITYAIQYDQIEILKFLIQNGAKVNNIASGKEKTSN